MAAHCPNIRDPKYLALVQQTTLGQRELKARVTVWQDMNKTDSFPSIEQVEGLLEAPISGDNLFVPDQYLADNFPNIDNESLKTSVNNLKDNNKADELHAIGKDHNRLMEGAPTQRSFINAFINVYNAVTNAVEKSYLYHLYIDENNDMLEKLAQMYDDFLTYSEGYNSFDKITERVFNRMYNLGNAIHEKGSLLKSYIIQAPSSKKSDYESDSSAYEKIKGRISVHHKGKSQKQIDGSIKNAIRALKSNFSDKVQVKVSQPKETKKGTVTFVYVEKPNKKDYFNAQYETPEISDTQRKKLMANKQEWFGDSNETTLKEILDKVSATSKNKVSISGELAKYISNASNAKVVFVAQDYLIDESLETVNNVASGLYTADVNTIYLPVSGLTMTTLLHEGIHAMTVTYLKNNPNSQLTKDFIALYEHVKGDLLNTGDDLYGITDEYEFAAELFTNKAFINRVKDVPPLEGVKTYPNIFRAIFDKILEMIGFKSKKSTAYEQAFSIASNVIKEYFDYTSSNEADALAAELSFEASRESIVDWGNMNNFFSKPAKRKVINSPYTGALKRLNSIYDLTDLKDLTSSVTTEFINIVSWYHEGNPEMTRQEIIEWITPARLFEEAKEEFKNYLDDYKEAKTEQKYIDNMSKLLDNYDDLAMIASIEINFLEGLKFGYKDFKPYKYNLDSELDNGTSQDASFGRDGDFYEETILDGWMKNFKFSSVNDSLTNQIKRALRSVDETDKNGNSVPNSIGLGKKLSLDVIKNDLLVGLQTVITSKDLMPTLTIMSKAKPWVTSLIKYLQEDDELFSQFYSVLKKDFTLHSIVKVIEMPDGTVKYETVEINRSNDEGLWAENWRRNLENNAVNNKRYSIYNTDGTINVKNATNNTNIIKELIKEWKDVVKLKDVEDRKSFLSRKNITIKNQLNAVGIELSNDAIKNLFADALVDTEATFEQFGIKRSSFYLNTILDKLFNINNDVVKNTDKYKNPIDIYMNNKGNYNGIATIVSKTQPDLIEGSVHENGKSYYTYLQPSYLSKLMKQLKNVRGSKSDFNDFINTQFKQFVGTLYNEETGKFNISWINALTDPKTGEAARDLLEHKVVLNFDKTDYDSVKSAPLTTMLLAEYFAQKETAWFHVPILADAPSAEFIKFKKITYDYKNNVISELMHLFDYEYNRIKMIRARKEGIKNGSIKSIKNYDTRGDRFVYLDFLNEHLEEIDSYMSGEFKGSSQTLYNAVHDWMLKSLDEKAAESLGFMKELGLLEKTKNGKYKYLDAFGINDTNLEDRLGEYFYNSYLATANIIQITSTDLSYYANVEDFQKRNKEKHAPGSMVNTQARYKGERIGKDEETYIILKDSYVNSSDVVYEYIQQIVDDNTMLSQEDKNTILKSYKKDKGAHNVTDAQAYRSLDSAKTVIAMSTGWNDKLEATYQRLKKGEWDMADYNVIMQAFKPFVYTQTTVDSGIMIDSNDPSKGNYMIKVPTQHKNSETILLPMHGIQFNSPKLEGLMQAMAGNGKDAIDVVMFESAVKVGLQGALDISNMNDAKQIAKYIKSYKDNNQVFKKISYEDYKIQQPVPEHLQDTSQLFGSQLRKLLMSDISPDAEFDVRGKVLKRGDLISLYNTAITENLLDSYNSLVVEFGSVEKLQDTIEKELRDNSRYSKDLFNAIQLDSEGNFILPLFDPSQSGRIQQLLNSIWKTRVTKQKIKGGSTVQMSAFGVSEDLEIKFKTVNGKTAVDYMEVYLPFWSKEIPANWERDFIDPKTGVMSVEKMLAAGVIDEEFLEGISYRIPTEGKYSMWNFKVKGFLPRNAGGNIIKPVEHTTVTGSDFDVDKLFLMLKEFIFDKKTGKFTSIKPDINVDPKDMTTEERDNLLIDIARSVLSNPDTAIKQLTPGNFDKLKAVSRKLNILATGEGYTWPQVKSLGLAELDAISQKKQLDILDFTTQVKLHKQNMTAAKVIGIAANHSTNHAVRQNTKMELTPLIVKNKEGEAVPHDRFKINGRFLTSLHSTLTPDGKRFISTDYSQYSAASVDAVKDPVLSSINIDTFTADTVFLLTGLGYEADEVGLFVRQPVIEELVNFFDKVAKDGVSKDDAIKMLLNKYRKILETELNTPVYGNLYEGEGNNFTSDRMAEMIDLGAKLRKLKYLEGNERDTFIHTNYGTVQDFYKYQYQVLLNYAQMQIASSKLSDFIRASKGDTSNGGAGPTIADTEFRLRNIERHIDNCYPQSGNPVIANADVLHMVPEKLMGDTKALRKYLRSSQLGFVQSFTTLGLQATKDSFSKHFPHYKDYFKFIFDKMEKNLLKTGRLSVDMMNNLYNEFFAYYMSQFSDFNRESAREFTRDFPKKFMSLVRKHPELNDLQLIKNIQLVNPGNESPFAKLKFRAGGRLSSNVRDSMIMEWESLLYQPEFRQLAMDMFKYNYFLNGFSFGTASFMHLVPAAVKLEMPGFTENLYKLMEDSKSEGSFAEEELYVFIDQYYRNHLSNRKLVPTIKSLSEDTFKNGEEATLLEELEVAINTDDNSDFFTINGGTLPYIAVNINGTDTYYKVTFLNDINTNTIKVALNKAINLGVRNNILEYDFGNANLESDITESDYDFNYSNEDYENSFGDVALSQDRYNYEYSPESSVENTTPNMPSLMEEHIKEAFQFIGESNNKFKGSARFESLTEEDMPTFTGRDNSLAERDNSTDVEDITKEEIEQAKKHCKG